MVVLNRPEPRGIRQMKCIALAQRALSLLSALAIGVAAGGCANVGEWLVGGEPRLVPKPTVTPSNTRQAAIAAPVGGVINGSRPYLTEAVPPITLHYEPWIDYATVQLVKNTFATAIQAQQTELGLPSLPHIDAYVTWETPFDHFASQNAFQQPSWLAGFAAYDLSAGHAGNAKIYVNAQATGIVHNTAHELTHIAAPSMPQWLAEGVAEYIGDRVDEVLTPREGQLRQLQARSKVRQAIRNNTFFAAQSLQDFHWESPPDYPTLELAYAESWQMVEYVRAVYGKEALATLITDYAGPSQYASTSSSDETLATFEAVTGKPAQEVFKAFAAEALTNLTTEEQTGESFCTLSNIIAVEADFTDAWSQFSLQNGGQDPRRFTAAFQQFAKEWRDLGVQTAKTPAPGEAAPVRDAIAAYLQAIQQAMDQLAQGNTNSANRTLQSAFRLRTLAQEQLHQALTDRSKWLSCGTTFPRRILD